MARKAKVREEVEEQEAIAPGVVRDEGRENPLEDNPMEKKPRSPGAWKKVTSQELMALEASGKLVGYDPSTQEALIKEN